MINFNLKNIDEKTNVRTGVLKSKQKSFSTPNRLLVSTELNYPTEIKDVVKDIEYPNDFVLAQIKIDAKSLWTRDSDYYNSIVKQAKRYSSQILDKPCIFKPLLFVEKRIMQKDGRFKKTKKSIHTLDLGLDEEQIKRIIRSVVQIADDADYDALSLPYLYRLFRLNSFFKDLKTANGYATQQLTSGIQIMPQLPHTDNIADFEMTLDKYHNEYGEGIICFPARSNIKYRHTHNAIKDFSLSNKSEKIGLMCIDAPRKHPTKEVSHPHYTILQGYDFVAREIPQPFQRDDGKGAHQKVVEAIQRFNQIRLSIDEFDKGLLFDENKVNTTCQYFNKFSNKELFRETLKKDELDIVLKVMETFDSHKEMQDCQPYIADSDFKTYLRARQSLNNAFRDDFSHIQKGLSDFA